LKIPLYERGRGKRGKRDNWILAYARMTDGGCGVENYGISPDYVGARVGKDKKRREVSQGKGKAINQK
jgi:hypothetical protein